MHSLTPDAQGMDRGIGLHVPCRCGERRAGSRNLVQRFLAYLHGVEKFREVAGRIFCLPDSGSASNCACHCGWLLPACRLTVMIRSCAVTQSLFGHRSIHCAASSPDARSSKCQASAPGSERLALDLVTQVATAAMAVPRSHPFAITPRQVPASAWIGAGPQRER
jgi:hypothetical protein